MHFYMQNAALPDKKILSVNLRVVNNLKRLAGYKSLTVKLQDNKKPVFNTAMLLKTGLKYREMWKTLFLKVHYFFY